MSRRDCAARHNSQWLDVEIRIVPKLKTKQKITFNI